MHRTKFFIGALWVALIGLSLAAINSGFFLSRATNHQDGTSLSYFSKSSEAKAWCLYDSDPNHIWNRLYRALYMRTARKGQEYGYDELDPLIWSNTKYLFSGEANQRAIKTLDEFLATHAERIISDPLKRAMLQRDLWAVFSWTTEGDEYSPSPARRELEIRLAQAIRRLSLPAEQIRALPNNYEDAVSAQKFSTKYDQDLPQAPFLPADLFQSNGSWVLVSAEGVEPAARAHVAAFFGRSTFLIFMRLPAGREATLAYLKQTSEFPRPWSNEQDPQHLLPNLELPQFPVGTELALVRQMMLIDDRGSLTPTSIIEGVQIRVHRRIPQVTLQALDRDRMSARTSLDTYEFKMSRLKLFAGESGGLRPVARDEREFPLFGSHGIDLFELPGEGPNELGLSPVLSQCASCHYRPGIHSVLSRSVRRNLIPAGDSKYEARATVGWQQRQYSWGLLQGLWQQQPTRVRKP